MPPGSAPYPAPRSQRAFALWVLAMLLVVLLSAMPSGGQARTRLVGSAFDPTTVSVALSPKQPKAKTSAQAPDRRRLPDTASGDGPVQLALAPAAALVIARSVEAGASPFAQPATVAGPRALTRAHGARAPPEA